MFDDETLETLKPSQEMAPLLQTLSGLLAAHECPDPAQALLLPWDELPFEDIARGAAMLPLMLEGWPLGAIPPDEFSAGDLLHELSVSFGIMSAEDLDEQFRLFVDGARSAADFRRVTDAPSLKRLIQNDAALGWSGFDIVPRDQELVERMRRRRMAADFFRGSLSWTALRGWDVAQGAALIAKARAADMISEAAAAPYWRRAAGELILRHGSWHSLSRSLLLGTFWDALAESSRLASEALSQTEGALEKLLGPGAPWSTIRWVQIENAGDLPEVF